jgi:hypothetical protein
VNTTRCGPHQGHRQNRLVAVEHLCCCGDRTAPQQPDGFADARPPFTDTGEVKIFGGGISKFGNNELGLDGVPRCAMAPRSVNLMLCNRIYSLLTCAGPRKEREYISDVMGQKLLGISFELEVMMSLAQPTPSPHIERFR